MGTRLEGRVTIISGGPRGGRCVSVGSSDEAQFVSGDNHVVDGGVSAVYLHDDYIATGARS